MQGKYSQSNWYFQPTDFFIETTLDGKLMYIKDGEVLKQEKFNNIQSGDILRNLEQIKNLTWYGQYSFKNKKIGNWQAYWQGKQLKVGGNYDNKGKKIGKWIELFDNYWDLCKLISEGEYQNGIKIGIWQYYYDGKMISLGIYNNEGLKNGNWVDLYENFWSGCQVKFAGTYKSGLKQGNWDTLFQQKYYDTFNKMYFNNNFSGGGFYDKNGIKQGNWIELQESFSDSFLVTSKGEYRCGKKVGRWNIYFGCSEIQDYHIGGGLYDDNGGKIGVWIQLCDNQSRYLNLKKIENQIQFRRVNIINKKKLEDGTIYLKIRQSEEEFTIKMEKNQINGQNCIKIFQSNLFKLDLQQSYCQIIYIGQYFEGIKQGRWDIKFKYKEVNLKDYGKIGGGMYDKNGRQNGMWIDVDETFSNQSQVSYQGEYNEGIKIGKWDYVLNRNNKNKLDIFGGGFYDQDGKKKGKWINFHTKFSKYLNKNFIKISDFQVIYLGEYKNGIKFGKWENKYRFETKEQLKNSGVGNYDHIGRKIGKWIYIDFEFQFGYELIHIGNYFKGIQQGKFLKKMLPLQSLIQKI
ncbi:unnamed protein product [Paramecium pentaurelia]|uniref:Uncharacterized protein n=1 Tax=Paramecium pentaurelia TaxID=43138 RepID=A0A8S1VA15_9CILI|nr:unnamed protein product [Paramecium pentaurelia]